MEDILNEAVSDNTNKDLAKHTNEQIDELLDSKDFIINSKTKPGKLLKISLGQNAHPTIPVVIKDWRAYVKWEYVKKTGSFIKYISKSLFSYELHYEGIDYENTKKYGILFIKIRPDFTGSLYTFHDLKHVKSRFSAGYWEEVQNGRVNINSDENTVISLGLLYKQYKGNAPGDLIFFSYLKDSLKDATGAKDFDFYANLIINYLKSKELITDGSCKNAIIRLSRYSILNQQLYNFEIYKELLEDLKKVVDKYKEYSITTVSSVSGVISPIELSENDFKKILKTHFDIDFEEFVKEHSGTKDLDDSGLF